jgi:hypothetical protein
LSSRHSIPLILLENTSDETFYRKFNNLHVTFIGLLAPLKCVNEDYVAFLPWMNQKSPDFGKAIVKTVKQTTSLE